MHESGAVGADLEAELQRAVDLYRRSVSYALHDPESSLTKARQFAESVGRHLYVAARLERQARPVERLELNELLSKLEAGAVVPKHISTHFRVIQTYGNFGTHDQGRASSSITTEYIDPCIDALRQVARWYLSDHHGRNDLADRFVGTTSVPFRSSAAQAGIDAWREQYWWTHRTGAPKVLDLKMLESIQSRNELTPDEVRSIATAFKRDVAHLQQALLDAFEDGLLEVVESDALEAIRLDGCVSAREAEQFVRERRPVNLDCKAVQPEWLIRGLREARSEGSLPPRQEHSGSQFVSENTPPLGASSVAIRRSEPQQLADPRSGALRPQTFRPDVSAAAPASPFEAFLALAPMARAELLTRLVSRFFQPDAPSADALEKLRHGVSSCQIPAREPIVAAFDLTLMGSGTDAFIITSEALYVHNPWYSAHSGRHRTSWTELAAAKIKIADSEIVIDRGADSMFIWSWNEHKNIKRTLLVIQQYLHS